MDFGTALGWTFWGNTLGAWSAAVAVGLGVGFGLWLVARGLVSRIRALADRTATDLDNLVVDLVLRTRGLVIFLVAVWAASLTLELSGTVQARIRSVLVLGLLIQAGIWASGVVMHFLDAYKRRTLEADPGVATAVGALRFMGRLVIWSLVLLVALDNLGLDITTLVTTLGIGGIAIALALQNVLSDLFASLSIVFDKPFVVGDFIVVGDLLGTVEHVGLKTTRVRALGGEQLVFSNHDLLDSRIRNFKRMNERRIVFQVGVQYDTGFEKLQRIPGMIREIVVVQERVRFDRSHFKSFGDSSLDFETVYYMLVPDYTAYMDAQQAINLEIYRRFAEENIEFAFPTRTVHLYAAAGEPGPS